LRSDRVPVLFRLLVDNNIHSVPVLNNKGGYYGFVDMMDIVTYVGELIKTWSDFSPVKLSSLFAEKSRLSNSTVGDIMDFPVKKLTPFHPHFAGTSLFSAWESLAKEGVHRIPIIRTTEDTSTIDIDDIITHSMMIDFLWQNIEKITTAADMKVSIMNKPRWLLGTIRDTKKAIAAFKKMGSYEFSGLAIIDINGKLVGNMSVRDIKGLGWDGQSWYRLWDTCISYKKKILSEYPNTPSRLLCVTNQDNLYTVVEKMATEHVHRIYVVDSLESMKPIRVITQTDVLKQLLDNLERIHPVRTAST